MLSLLALLAPAFANTTDHAALHPRDAFLYLEAPELQSFFEHYPEARLQRFLADPAIKNLGDSAGIELKLDLVRVLGDFLDTVLQTTGSSASIRGARTFSLSARLPSATTPTSVQIVVDFVGVDALNEVTGFAVSALELEPSSDALPGFRSWAAAEAFGATISLHAAEQRLVVLVNATQDDLAARLTRPGGLATDAEYVAVNKGLSASSGASGTVFASLFHRSSLLEGLVRLLQRSPELEALRDRWTPFVGQKLWRMELVDGVFRSHAFGPRPDEDVSLFSGGPVAKSELWSRLPADAMAVFGGTWNANTLNATLSEALQGAQALGEVRLGEQESASLARLAASLGPDAVGYSQPLKGLGLPQAFLWVSLRDEAAFLTEAAAWTERIGSLVPGIEGETKEYRVKDERLDERIKIPITSFRLPQAWDPGVPGLALNPAYAIVDGTLLASPSAQHLKRELKRLYRLPEEGDAVWNAHPLPADARTLIWFDWSALLGGLVNLGKSMGALAGVEQKLLNALPDEELFRRYFVPTVNVTRATKEGLVVDHTSFFGPEVWAAPLYLVGFFFLIEQPWEGGIGGGSPTARPVAEPAPPAEPVLDGRADTDSTQNALDSVRVGIEIYRIDTGTLPTALDDLNGTSQSFPDGYLGGGTVPDDAWGHALLFEAQADGSYRLWSMGANGIDEQGGGDDVESGRD